MYIYQSYTRLNTMKSPLSMLKFNFFLLMRFAHIKLHNYSHSYFTKRTIKRTNKTNKENRRFLVALSLYLVQVSWMLFFSHLICSLSHLHTQISSKFPIDKLRKSKWKCQFFPWFPESFFLCVFNEIGKFCFLLLLLNVWYSNK